MNILNSLKNIYMEWRLHNLNFIKEIFNRIKHYYLNLNFLNSYSEFSKIWQYSKISTPYKLYNVYIWEYSYISNNSDITDTTIWKFCSISYNFKCWTWNHPLSWFSTAPIFYSTTAVVKAKSFSKTNKIQQQDNHVTIWNDVRIWTNVIILWWVTIWNWAVIWAGSVVTKDIPPYAIVYWVPAKIHKYRFCEKTIDELESLKRWDFPECELQLLEPYFFDINQFIKKAKVYKSRQKI